MYALMTQRTSDKDASRCSLICGIAMFTIVVSSRIMKKPRQRTTRTSQGLYLRSAVTSGGVMPRLLPQIARTRCPNATIMLALLHCGVEHGVAGGGDEHRRPDRAGPGKLRTGGVRRRRQRAGGGRTRLGRDRGRCGAGARTDPARTI